MPGFPALILISHGSLLCGAAETLRAHARTLSATGEWSAVEVAFLNYSEPRFDASAARCAAKGAERVVVVPYFLVPGKFVRVDVAACVERAARDHPGVRFILAEPLGFDSALAEAVGELAEAARPPQRWRDDLWRAPDFCEHRPECPMAVTLRCPLQIEDGPRGPGAKS